VAVVDAGHQAARLGDGRVGIDRLVDRRKPGLQLAQHACGGLRGKVGQDDLQGQRVAAQQAHQVAKGGLLAPLARPAARQHGVCEIRGGF
jgi:hypothetical protein